MRNVSRLGALVLVLALAVPSVSHTRAAEVKLDVTKHVLKNGMRLLIVERHDAPTVATHLRFNVGGVDDPKGQTGIAHLLEHMMFKGTTTFGTTDSSAEAPLLARLDELWAQLDAEKSKASNPFEKPDTARIEAIQKEIADATAKHKQYVVKNELWQTYQRLGGTGLNASTGDDSTQYYVQLPSNQLEIWAKLESDRIANPVFREFYSERDVVHEERRLRTDTQPRGLFQEAFSSTAYIAHPYRQPVVGWSSDIDSTVRSEVLDYFRTFYAPNNCIAVLVGDLDPQKTIALVEKYFGPIPAKPQPRRRITEEPPQTGERRVAMSLDAAPSLSMAWHVPAQGHPDAPALTVASQILSGSGGGGFGGGGPRGRGRGGSATGRFQRKLVQEQQVALNAMAMSRPGRYPGLFTASATPAPGKSLDDLEKAVLAEVERLATDAPTEEELGRVRNAVEAMGVRQLSSNMGIANAIASAEALSGDWHWLDKERELLRAVTAEDVQRVVKTYLTKDNRTVGQLIGRGERQEPGARRAGEVQGR
jgi:predicted Zn-dependent peptidase